MIPSWQNQSQPNEALLIALYAFWAVSFVTAPLFLPLSVVLDFIAIGIAFWLCTSDNKVDRFNGWFKISLELIAFFGTCLYYFFTH